jgi:peptidoglycan-associated lipoprotein
MQHRTLQQVSLFCSFFALLGFAAGCKKQVAAKPPTAAPAAPSPQPTVTLNASPASVSPGATVTLSWSSTNATTLDIEPGVGQVAPQGSTPVTPTESTTYTITATGSGGTATASARVSVGASGPTSTAPPPSTGPANVSDLFSQNIKDAFFDLDKSDINADARAALTKDAEFLRSYPQVRISLEGHCDERGSTEYNLGLGQRRAEAAKNYMVSLGISADRIETVSWGKERPFCSTHDDACWQQNRRAHLVMAH